MGQIYDMLYQKLRVPDYITYLGTCIYIFGQTGGVIWPLSLCPLLVAQVIVYIILNMHFVLRQLQVVTICISEKTKESIQNQIQGSTCIR